MRLRPIHLDKLTEENLFKVITYVDDPADSEYMYERRKRFQRKYRLYRSSVRIKGDALDLASGSEIISQHKGKLWYAEIGDMEVAYRSKDSLGDSEYRNLVYFHGGGENLLILRALADYLGQSFEEEEPGIIDEARQLLFPEPGLRLGRRETDPVIPAYLPNE